MRSAINGRVAKRFSALGLLGIACCLPLGCGADDKFAAETDDEYTEALTNAIIGTPTGVVEISSDGRSTSQRFFESPTYTSRRRPRRCPSTRFPGAACNP